MVIILWNMHMYDFPYSQCAPPKHYVLHVVSLEPYNSSSSCSGELVQQLIAEAL
jgi:hypothetical protein